ncbi:MAG: aminoacyl-tRNA hydrolase [Patescibacteria group bacterium]
MQKNNFATSMSLPRKTKKPFLFIGLGNPGANYANTYHNAGFLFADHLSDVSGQVSNVAIIKSSTFMNASGEFVKKALKKHGLKPENLVLVHDDSDIELGNYKLSFGRNSAGHKGAGSAIKSLGTKNFWRLRIGIRPKITNYPPALLRPPASNREASRVGNAKRAGKFQIPRRAKAEEFVLKKISTADKKTLEAVFEKIVASI